MGSPCHGRRPLFWDVTLFPIRQVTYSWVFNEATFKSFHYSDVIMGAMASQITSLTIVYSTVYSGADQRKHQSSVSFAFVWGIHRSPVNSPHKWSVIRKMLPFDDVIMWQIYIPFAASNLFTSCWALKTLHICDYRGESDQKLCAFPH